MTDLIRTIIVDDEEHCINSLSNLLKQYFSHNILVEACCTTVAGAVVAIKEMKPRLVFLDVQIGDETGFDLLRQLPQASFEVIFTTAYDKYAVQAFKCSAVDYLLKPVTKDDLQQAVEKLAHKINLAETAMRLQTLFHNLANPKPPAKRICVPVASGLVFLQVNDIIHCESNINYTTLHLTDKKKLVVSKTLKEFEEMLSGFNFFRVHNSHLVNLEYIKSYNKSKGGFVTLADGTEIEVATRRRDDFLKSMK